MNMVKWGSLTWPTQWSDLTSTYGLDQVRSPCVPGLGSSFHHANLLKIVLSVYTNKNVQILTSSYSSTSLLDKFTCFKPVIVVIIHSRPFVFWVLSIFVQSNIFYQGAQFLLWQSSISTSLLWRALLWCAFSRRPTNIPVVLMWKSLKYTMATWNNLDTCNCTCTYTYIKCLL
jgi:hypothetical protein